LCTGSRIVDTAHPVATAETFVLDSGTHQKLARDLDAAERTGVQLEHFSKLYPSIEIADSYAIQQAWTALKRSQGRTVRGHKIGLTSRVMQIQSQIDEPDYGALFDNMFFESGAVIPAARFIVPRLEVELAFVLARPLRLAPNDPAPTVAEVLAATEYVVPALEIIDARIEQFDRVSKAPRRVFDTIADNAASAGVVTGGRRVAPGNIDLRWCGALLGKNGSIEESGLAAAVLDHPANGVAWLAKKLAPYGEGLDAGEFVLAGSFTRPVAAAAGDSFRVDYGPLGVIDVRFN
jgi:2-oxo-hept-3-ene-1,7-dioate hydratase